MAAAVRKCARVFPHNTGMHTWSHRLQRVLQQTEVNMRVC
jgi:hypothetical protein